MKSLVLIHEVQEAKSEARLTRTASEAASAQTPRQERARDFDELARWLRSSFPSTSSHLLKRTRSFHA